MNNLRKISFILLGVSLFGFNAFAEKNDGALSKKVSSLQLSINALAFEYCACTFVMERDADFCKKYVFEGIPLPQKLFSIKVNEDKKNVRISSRLTLTILGSKAKFTEESGCQIQ
jgi:hypothetical protein